MAVRVFSDTTTGERLAEEAPNLARRSVSRTYHKANVEQATGHLLAAGRLQQQLPAGLRRSEG